MADNSMNLAERSATAPFNYVALFCDPGRTQSADCMFLSKISSAVQFGGALLTHAGRTGVALAPPIEANLSTECDRPQPVPARSCTTLEP